MVTRAEAAAATRLALLGAADVLLDEGGPELVTLREVGARAGVSRGAPYGHFASKQELLTAVATRGWVEVGEHLERLKSDSSVTSVERVHNGLLAVLELARKRTHLYELMFTRPAAGADEWEAAASRVQDLFLSLIADLIPDGDSRATGALLMSTTHGVAMMERSGQLGTDKWGVSAEGLIDRVLRDSFA